MGLFWALRDRSQTRVPGFALSCPYHCTSASSEHSGLLRKQLSLKDLRRTREQGETLSHSETEDHPLMLQTTGILFRSQRCFKN